jgi:hypothetical protein
MSIIKDIQVVRNAMSVVQKDLEKDLTFLAPTVGIPAALKKIENEQNLKRTIQKGKYG